MASVFPRASVPGREYYIAFSIFLLPGDALVLWSEVSQQLGAPRTIPLSEPECVLISWYKDQTQTPPFPREALYRERGPERRQLCAACRELHCGKTH